MESRGRALTTNERETIELILSRDKPGFDALRSQLPGLLVSGECDDCGDSGYCPSIRLSPDKESSTQSSGSGRIPGGHGWRVPPGPPPPADPDAGEPAFYSLYVEDGWLDYLEVSHVGDSMPEMPPAWTITVDW